MNSVDFKSGCSVHIEYTPKDLGELKEVMGLLQDYQCGLTFDIAPPEGKPKAEKKTNGERWNGRDTQANLNNGNGSRKSALGKDTLDELFGLARKKKVFLKKMAMDMFGKKVTELYGGEAQEIREELLTY
jgi:hypothetical protein